MPDFTYEGVTIAAKSDYSARPAHIPANQWDAAADYNAHTDAVVSLRTATLAGQWQGFSPRSAGEITTLSAASTYRLAVRDSDKALVYWNGTTLTALGAGGGGSAHTIRNDAGDLAARTGLHFLTADFVVADDAGGDETDISLASTVVRTSRTISVAGDLTGGGDLSANRTITLPDTLTAKTIATDDATDDDLTTVLTVQHTTSGGAAPGIGVAIALNAEDSAGNAQLAARVAGILSVVTNGVERGYLELGGVESGAADPALYVWGSKRAGINTGATLPAGALEVKTAEGVSVPGLIVDKASADGATNIAQEWRQAGTARLTAQFDANENPQLVVQSGKALLLSTDGITSISNPTAAGSPSTYLPSYLRLAYNYRLAEGAATSGSVDIYGTAISTGRQELRVASGGTDLAAFQTNGGGLFLYHEDSINQSPSLLTLRYTTSGTAGAGIGSSILFETEDDGGAVQSAARLSGVLSVATAGSEKGYALLEAANGSGSLAAGLYAWGTGRVGIGTGTTEPAGHLHSKSTDGAALTPVIAERGEAAAAALTLIDLRRNGASKGTIELDASDRLLIKGGGTNFIELSSTRARITSPSGSGVIFLDDATLGARMTYGSTYVEANGTDILLVSAGATKVYGGPLRYMDAARFQTTVGAAGGASALPATPTKYGKFVDDGGTTYVFPLYAAS
jgi:hypothetical protein